jgi:hypothetical protein
MILLPVVFITCIPNMLKAGNKIGMIKNTLSDMLKLIVGREKTVSLLTISPMIVNIINARLNEIKSDTIANGVSYPRLASKLFTNNPKNIKKEMLSPTDNTSLSVSSILYNFRIRRINKPGKMVRKMNPKICLMNGMFKRIAKSVRRSSEIININHCFCPNFNAILTS